ncbi:MAG: hypothetical protein ACK5L7_02975 [Paludibacteraceae bacterium]
MKIRLESSLDNKKVHECFVLSSEEDCVILSPSNNEMITQLFDNEHLHFFLEINKKDKCEINSAFFSIKNYNVRLDPFRINRKIDVQKSFFVSESNFENAGANTLLYFNWGREKEGDFDTDISGEKEFLLVRDANTVTFLNDIADIDILKDKKIKRITCIINESYSPAYLDIVCKDGRKMEYIPASLLQLPDEFDIFFDNIEVDVEKSRFLIPTFNEKEYRYKITFMW